MDSYQSATRPVLHTTVAIVLAFVVYAAAALLAEGFLFIVNSGGWMPTGVVRFIVAAIGAAIGIYAARMALDAWLPDYVGGVVFAAFGLIVTLVILLDIFVPNEPIPANGYASLLATAVAAWFLFWKKVEV